MWQSQLGLTIPPNQLEVWIVENEVGESFPWTPLARNGNCQYLMTLATNTAIWDGKMNTSFPELVDTGNMYPVRVPNSKKWKVLTSILGPGDELALYCSVVVHTDHCTAMAQPSSCASVCPGYIRE